MGLMALGAGVAFAGQHSFKNDSISKSWFRYIFLGF